MNEKYAVMTPFNIIQKMLGPYMFGPTSRETLGDKMELYFQDYSFVPLFVQVRFLFFLHSLSARCILFFRFQVCSNTDNVLRPCRRII